MASDSYTVKEILNEMRKENDANFTKINTHLATLNSKVATNVERIGHLSLEGVDRETRIRIMEKTSTRTAVIISIGVFLAMVAMQLIVPKILG